MNEPLPTCRPTPNRATTPDLMGFRHTRGGGSWVVTVQDGFKDIEARLAATGFTGGLHALVERWQQHTQACAAASLIWEYQDGPLFPPRHQAAHDHGIFIVDATNYGDEWVLKHEWPGWGWRELGGGTVPGLKKRALQLMREGGPFGGPAHIFRAADPTTRSPVSGMLRHASPDGELRTGTFLPGLSVLLHVRLDGTFALRQLDPADLGEPAKLATALGPVESMVLAQGRVPWTFTESWPLLGLIRATAFDVLLCWLGPEEVAVIAVKYEPHGLHVGTWAAARDLDLDRWLSSLPDKPLARAASSPRREAPPLDATTQRPSTARAELGEVQPAAGSPRVRVGAPPPPPPPPTAPPRRSSFAAPHRGGVPAPPGRTATQRVEPLQAVRLPAPLADALAAYFAVVEGELPARQTGADFARELMWVLVRAAIAGAATMTGAPGELLAMLHRQGHLRTLPSDQVGRDALKILAAHTPLVLRIHYRRWCLAFGDLLDAESPLRVELRRYESA